MNELTKETASLFESIRRTNENGVEYWSARDLGKLIGYASWQKFLQVVEKAEEACKNTGMDVSDHFNRVVKLVTIGSGAERKTQDIELTRYACYLVAQNGDPRKPEIAQAQTYFAIQTRYAEIQQMEAYQELTTEESKRLFLREQLRAHNSRLADAAHAAGVVTPLEYAIFQNAGYKGMYNGLTAKGIHRRKGLTEKQDILDHMGSTELAANLFRATQAEEKIRKENIHGKANANAAHHEVGKEVREAIKRIGGTMPEDLPSVESIKAIESKKRKLLKASEPKQQLDHEDNNHS